MRMVKFDIELENEIKKFHDSYWREVRKEKPKIVEKGTCGQNDWSISIGNIKDGNSKN